MGPLGTPTPHRWQRGSGHPATAQLWHGASQAVAPMRAMSCEAAPRLGVTISLTTQSEGKTSPSSPSVVSTEGVGWSIWECHYLPHREMLRFQHRHLLLPKENEDPPQKKRITCNTDGKQGGPH